MSRVAAVALQATTRACGAYDDPGGELMLESPDSCFPFTDVLSVCTDVEFDVCGICGRLSTFSES